MIEPHGRRSVQLAGMLRRLLATAHRTGAIAVSEFGIASTIALSAHEIRLDRCAVVAGLAMLVTESTATLFALGKWLAKVQCLIASVTNHVHHFVDIDDTHG